MNDLEKGGNLSRDDAIILRPVTMHMILGYDEITRKKSKFNSLTKLFRDIRSIDAL
jgi:hypothetical protein